ncbi:MAG: RNA methyltransferase [Pseudomonadota bacterium]
MAGTNDAAALGEPQAIDGPAFILVAPQLGQNIGACCRAMWNFGLTDLRLVAPRDGWPNEDAIAMASGASRVLEAARVYETTGAAAAEIAHLYATTARGRELTKRVLSPAEAAAEIAARQRAGEPCGVLFGPERTGLENDDVIRANAIVTVPANPRFASLNLAQCALLMGYELRQAILAQAGAAPAPERPEALAAGAAPAPREAVDGLYAHLEEELDAANYFWPEHKRAAMVASLRNFLSRAPMTDQDARMLRGVVRTLAQKRRRRSEG